MPLPSALRPSVIWRALGTASVRSSTRKPSGRRSLSSGGAAAAVAQATSPATRAARARHLRSRRSSDGGVAAAERAGSVIAASWLATCQRLDAFGGQADLRAGADDL